MRNMVTLLTVRRDGHYWIDKNSMRRYRFMQNDMIWNDSVSHSFCTGIKSYTSIVLVQRCHKLPRMKAAPNSTAEPMWGTNNTCCVLSVTAAKFLTATPKLFLEYLVLLLHLLHDWWKLQPGPNFAATLNKHSKQSQAFLAQWSKREQELSFSSGYPKKDNIFSSYEFWIKVMNST